MSDHDQQKVADAVRRHLPNGRLGGITLEVIESGIRNEGHWWYVPLRPSAWPEKLFEYYEALADLEETLDQEEQLKVFLVILDPEASAVASR
jgi:hypothetical protein